MGKKLTFSAIKDKNLPHFFKPHKNFRQKERGFQDQGWGLFQDRGFFKTGSNRERMVKHKKQLLKKIAKIWAFNSTLVKTLN